LEKKQFGKNGRKISEIGMGTYFDKRWIRIAKHGWRPGASKKVRALVAGLDGGMNLIDSAEAYESETFVAKAIKGRRRDELFIATKVWLDHLRRDDLLAALERSLRRLETSYVDLYQVHFPNPSVPISETMSGMEELKECGKILSIGVSNFSLAQLIDASSALRRSEIASIQVNYSLMHRDIERDLLPHCQKNGIVVLAYYPLGHGRLASEKVKMREVCRQTSKTRAQVALNWLASTPSVFPIPRASTPEHVRENIGASGWSLTPDQKAELERQFPAPVQERSPTNA